MGDVSGGEDEAVDLGCGREEVVDRWDWVGAPILPQARAMGRVTGRMRFSNWVARFESQRRAG